PWESTVRALCGLCSSSAITILSRWRDRKFGWHERILPIAIETLIKRKVLDPRDALPLIAIRADWDDDELLAQILAECCDAKEKKLAATIVYRYARLVISSSSSLRKFQDAAAQHDISFDDLAEAISLADQDEKDRERDSNRYEIARPLENETAR
ncbi:hypothetical protein, partial [Clavibacter michiganensis]